jgi:hypothetical protein
MPGDTLVPEPMFSVTHGVTIEAPLERVWPWLAQMGSWRGGWYSYDRIDNGGRASAERLLPDYQRIVPGDVLPALPGATDAFVVASVQPPFDLVLTVPGGESRGVPIVSWEHLIEPMGPERTRLLVRGRVSSDWARMARGAGRPGSKLRFIERVYRMLGALPSPLLIAIARAGHWGMEARHLRGIKRRAEAFR